MSTDNGEEKGPPTMNGLLLVVVLVAGGMGIGSIYYRWKAPDLIRDLRAQQAAVPSEGEPRLERWMDFGAPMIHGRLTYLRLSKQQPWLVSHVVVSAPKRGSRRRRLGSRFQPTCQPDDHSTRGHAGRHRAARGERCWRARHG